MNQSKNDLRCTCCNKKTDTVYIVARGELCIDCLIPEDVTGYPEFAEQLNEIREEKAA